MAHLRQDRRTGNWCVGFRFGGREYLRSCRTNRKPVALRIEATVEETIELLETGRLVLPDGVEPGHWILTGGKAVKQPVTANTTDMRFGKVCEAYLQEQHQKAESTRCTEEIHIGHLKRILRASTPMDRISLEKLKNYAHKRSLEKYRQRPISSRTIKKELSTFRQIWDWAEENGFVPDRCPLLGANRRWKLKLPKPNERTKFQTWEQIERQIRRGGLTKSDVCELWKGLYLDEEQVTELLAFVEEHAAYQFIYPMFAFTAYTGARRSEVVRSRLDDIDFAANQIMIRERKRRKHLARSTRFVPLHPRLCRILKEWFAVHPGGQFTIACPAKMPRRKIVNELRPLTRCQATHHFKHTLSQGKWNVVAGFHVLRHSFGSNLVRTGKVPPHVVAQWMGHTTDEMKQLYQHLFPQDGLAQISTLL